jgi:imidazoleglycerol-phosphate dehydratase
MDDALARVVVDLGGRPFARVALPLAVTQVEGLEAQLVPHFFLSFAQSAGATLHVDLIAGTDAHHAVEAAFKACARACRIAWSLRSSPDVLSTKALR